MLKNKLLRNAILSIGVASAAVTTGAVAASVVSVDSTNQNDSTIIDNGSKLPMAFYENVDFIGNFAEFINSDGTLDSQYNIYQEMFLKNPEKFVNNINKLSEDEKKSMYLETNLSNEKIPFNNGIQNYNTWSVYTTEVIYNSVSAPFVIADFQEFHNLLTANNSARLRAIFKSSQVVEAQSLTFSIDDNAKLHFDTYTNLVHIKVIGKNELITKSYDLAIPTSAFYIKLTATDVKVKFAASTNYIESNKPQILTLKNGISSEGVSKFAKLVNVSDEIKGINIDKMLSILGWRNEDSSLNKNKISSDLNLYNVDFSPIFTLNEKGNNKYTISFEATPSYGGFWTNGTRDAISFETGLISLNSEIDLAIFNDAIANDIIKVVRQIGEIGINKDTVTNDVTRIVNKIIGQDIAKVLITNRHTNYYNVVIIFNDKINIIGKPSTSKMVWKTSYLTLFDDVQTEQVVGNKIDLSSSYMQSLGAKIEAILNNEFFDVQDTSEANKEYLIKKSEANIIKNLNKYLKDKFENVQVKLSYRDNIGYLVNVYIELKYNVEVINNLPSQNKLTYAGNKLFLTNSQQTSFK